MGLDMMLRKKIYISTQYGAKDSIESRIVYTSKTTNETLLDAVIEPNIEVTRGEVYWRKANAIHHWFVTHVQDGEDDCDAYDLHHDTLNKLKETCQAILDLKNQGKESEAQEKAMDDLPPTSGLFFGDTEINEDYYDMLAYTIKGIDRLQRIEPIVLGEEGSKSLFTYERYEYSSSW